MSSPIDPTKEIAELVRSDSTPDLLRKALELFVAADPTVAQVTADKLDELCERRLAMTRADAEYAIVTDDPLDRTELNDRCDALTGRLMKYLGKLLAEEGRTAEPHLVLFAAARSLICSSVSVLGVDKGLLNARLIFEEALKELTPMLREMPETVI